METRTIQALRAVAQGRRHDLGLSQADVAEKAGVSRKWLSDFESGKESVELGKTLALLEALGLVLQVTVDGAAGQASSEDDLDAVLAAYRVAQ